MQLTAHRSTSQILWIRWVAANGLGELLGLGATFAVGAIALSSFEEYGGVAVVLLSFMVAVASGAIEATVLGLLQWRAMRPWFPTISARAWLKATLIGALMAYVLGYLPSTLMNVGEEVGQAPVAEPPQWVVLLLAAAMGALGGAVLSFAQWRVLRAVTNRASWWIPANMLAWLAGMPIIFWGIDVATNGLPMAQAVMVMAGVLLAAGTVVGAIHGIVLMWLSQQNVR